MQTWMAPQPEAPRVSPVGAGAKHWGPPRLLSQGLLWVQGPSSAAFPGSPMGAGALLGCFPRVSPWVQG